MSGKNIPTRRQFVSGATIGALGIAGATMLGCSPQKASEATDQSSASEESTVIDEVDNYPIEDATYLPRNDEYPTVPEPAPDQTDYDCDVLVIGGGLAGLNAAYGAAQAGKSVVLVDKGTPGYSGLSAWPSCNAYYDPERDADAETWDKYMIYSCDSFANLDWEDVWMQESMDTHQRLRDWGWIADYENGVEANYWVDGNAFHDDIKGYFRDFVGDKDRHLVFMRVLEENNVQVVRHTMITDLVEDEGRCVGAVGVHFKSGTFMKFSAKAVCMCTGSGVTKSSGFPVGADTFDGIVMAYNHGLPVTGLEFEDSHPTNGFCAGNSFMWCGWQYTEPIWPIGGTVGEETMAGYETPAKSGRWSSYISACKTGYANPDAISLWDEDGVAASVAFEEGDTNDPRSGKHVSPQLLMDRPGAAPGMPCHLLSGVWCGLDDVVGATQLPGLYVAGDGANASYIGGANYGCQRGSTSNVSSIQGFRAGNAAAEYADGVDATSLPDDVVAQMEESALQPLALEKGFDPSWVRDVLHGIISTPWVLFNKSEESLKSALEQVNLLRSMASGKLIAKNPHDLRLAREVENQMQAMTLKLHMSLNRTESRGTHYRSDYPFKDDANMLYYLVYTKGEDGEPVMSKVELKDRWKGDMSAPYEKRYPALETPEEIAKYAPESQGSWGKK